MQLDAGKLEGLDDDERKVMTRIVRRMWEAVGDDHVHIVTEVKARLSDDTDREFSSRSDETVSAGWKAVETSQGPEPEDEETANPAGGRNVIPSNLMEGGVIRPVGRSRSRKARPPAQTVHRGHAAGRDGAREPVRGGQKPQGGAR